MHVKDCHVAFNWQVKQAFTPWHHIGQPWVDKPAGVMSAHGGYFFRVYCWGAINYRINSQNIVSCNVIFGPLIGGEKRRKS